MASRARPGLGGDGPSAILKFDIDICQDWTLKEAGPVTEPV